MKKKLAFSAICCLAAIGTMACDICGSGVGGGYLGLLPGFRKKFISLRYLQNGLRSHLGPNGTTTYLTSEESFRTVELWGAINFGSKFRVAGFVPVNFMERTNGTGQASQSGLGDISAVCYYQLFDKQQTITGSKLMIQSLWLGTGVKLPTGKYNAEEKNIIIGQQNTFQLGTGSVDFTFNLMYDLRIQDAGINLNTGYKVNTYNPFEYKYGNKFTSNLLAYYKFRIGEEFSIAPNGGLLFETAAKDQKEDDIEVWETGGYSLMGTAGLELSFNKIGLGMNIQAPVAQELGEGKVQAKNRAMAYLSFSF